jgi:hypothetical protein
MLAVGKESWIEINGHAIPFNYVVAVVSTVKDSASITYLVKIISLGSEILSNKYTS